MIQGWSGYIDQMFQSLRENHCTEVFARFLLYGLGVIFSILCQVIWLCSNM